MKDYYSLFVKLSLQQCTNDDYKDKLKVKRHNDASKKLRKLQEEMKQNNCIEVLSKLLYYDDYRVKVNAASLCLDMNVFVNKAINTLKTIVDKCDDSTICFSAKVLLQSVL